MTDIVTIVGARPQFIKAAVVSKALLEAGIREEIIHTGQHYDARMSEIFFDELGIPTPAVNLDAGSGTHGAQTAQILAKTEAYLLGMPKKPAFVMVYGDTNSTIAGALAASKMGIRVIHVEAGLRSFNKAMPEEINRILTDHISDLLFCSSEIGVQQLAKEGITEGVFCTGDVMNDAVQLFSAFARSEFLSEIEEKFALLTLHRPVNTDSDKNLIQILEAVRQMGMDVVWPVHPRVKERLNHLDIPQNLKLTEPLSYFEMLAALNRTELVLTDSGGLQKEAYWLKKPCITLREETEWVETLQGSWNQLTGANTAKILDAIQKTPTTDWKPLYGDGKASDRIAKIIMHALNQ